MACSGTPFALLLCGSETWCSALRNESILRVLENRVHRQYLDQRGMKCQEAGEKCMMTTLIIYIFHLALLG
jgi:hypothetical protein